MNKQILLLMVAIAVHLSAISCSYAFGPLPESEEGKVEQLRSLKQPWETCKDKFLEIKQQLQRGKILYDVPLQKYDSSITQPNNNKIVLVGLEDNSTVFKAIFKPRNGSNLKVELGAFEIAEFLGLENLVPPLAVHECKGVKGLVSYYIDIEEEQNPWMSQCGFDQIKEKVSPQSLNNYYAFVKIFGMWDLKWVNTLIVGSNPPYHIMSLDNESLNMPVYEPKGEHFFVCWKVNPTCESSSYADLAYFNPTTLEKKDIPDAFPHLKSFFIHRPNIKCLKSPEEKDEAILKMIESYFWWGKESLPHYIGQKAWWVQLYNGNANIPPPHVESLSSFTLSRLNKLNQGKLKEFFQDLDPDVSLFPEGHYDAILMRCKDILNDAGVTYSIQRE